MPAIAIAVVWPKKVSASSAEVREDFGDNHPRAVPWEVVQVTMQSVDRPNERLIGRAGSHSTRNEPFN